MELTEKVRECLMDAFPGAEIHDLGFLHRQGRMRGHLAWEGFEGVDLLERQNQVHEVLRERFTRDEMSRLAVIFAWTPRELQSIHEDA